MADFTGDRTEQPGTEAFAKRFGSGFIEAAFLRQTNDICEGTGSIRPEFLKKFRTQLT